MILLLLFFVIIVIITIITLILLRTRLARDVGRADVGRASGMLFFAQREPVLGNRGPSPGATSTHSWGESAFHVFFFLIIVLFFDRGTFGCNNWGDPVRSESVDQELRVYVYIYI